MKILYAASEALPYASTGGLADVAGSLPKAVKAVLGKDSDVRLVMPLYPQVREKFAEKLELVCEINVRLSWRNQYCGIWKTVWMESVPCNHYSVCYNVCYIKQQEKYGRKLEIKEARLLANSLVFCIFIG